MIQGLITGFLLVAFVLGSIWVFSGRNKALFDAAARMPLDDERPTHPTETL